MKHALIFTQGICCGTNVGFFVAHPNLVSGLTAIFLFVACFTFLKIED